MQLRIILLQHWIYLENWLHVFILNFSHSIYPEQQKTTTNQKYLQIDLRIYAI